jgi:hypothetical protein
LISESWKYQFMNDTNTLFNFAQEKIKWFWRADFWKNITHRCNLHQWFILFLIYSIGETIKHTILF